MGDPLNNELNLKVLRKQDPYIIRILKTSKRSVLYEHQDPRTVANATWDQKDFDGSFFIYERQASPNYGVCIMNRTKRKNFFLTLLPDTDTHVENGILLLKSTHRINGFWFVRPEEAQDVYRFIKRILDEMRDPKSQKVNAATIPTNYQPDIVSMLKDARLNSNRKPASPFDHSLKNSGNSIDLDQLFTECREASTSPQRRASHSQNGSQPITIEQAHNPQIGQKVSMDAARSAPVLQRFASQPGTMEELAYAAARGGTLPQMPNMALDLSSLEGNFLEAEDPVSRASSENVLGEPADSVSLDSPTKRVKPSFHLNTETEDLSSLLNNFVLGKKDTGEGSSSRQCDSANSQYYSASSQCTKDEYRTSNRTDSRKVSGDSPPALSDAPPSHVNAPTAAVGAVLQRAASSKLMKPEDFEKTTSQMRSETMPEVSAISVEDDVNDISPLTSEQLKLSLIYMLQTDNDFVEQLHSVYSQRFSSIRH